MTTVGYGSQYPELSNSDWQSLTPIIAVLFSLVMDCFWIGLIFAHISRPSAIKKSVLFSDVAVIRPVVAPKRTPGSPELEDTCQCLQIRVMQMRGSRFQLVDPSIRLYFARWDQEANFLRFYQLKIENAVMPFMSLPWTITHVIDEDSPLLGESPTSLAASAAEVIAVWEGTDPLSGNSAQYKFSYIGNEVLDGCAFEDIVSYNDNGTLVVNVKLFHNVVQCGDTFQAQSLNVESIARV